jgi:hypothetical protein
MLVDGVGWVIGAPAKILLWDRRALNHKVSPETEASLVEYLAANGVEGTKVRINQYDPIGEWGRLRRNEKVGAGWRYTVGVLATAVYTIAPGRLLGADGYNPYTDTINIYSDIPALAMEQAGHAKLVSEDEHPGTYATLTGLPLISLSRESDAKDEVYEYVAENGSVADRLAAERTLYPQFGMEVGGQIGQFIPGGGLVTIAGAGVGHATAAVRRRGSRDDEPLADDSVERSLAEAFERPPSGTEVQPVSYLEGQR